MTKFPKFKDNEVAAVAIVIVVIIFLGLVVGGVYWFIIKKPEQPEDELANWKTYRNEEYGFEVKYPRDLNINEVLSIEDYQAIKTGPGEFWSEAFKERWQNRLKHKAIYAVGDKCIEPDDVAPVTDYDLSEIDCFIFQLDKNYVIKYTDPDSVDYIIITNNYEITFSFKENKDWVFNQILSTFKFIEIDETANWKTYRNEIIGIEFKYPNEWPELGNEERGDEEGTSFALNFPDLSHLNHTYPDYDNMPVDEQYEQIKCKYKDLDAKCKEKIDLIGFENMSPYEQLECGNIDIECEEKISINDVKYVWRISWNFRVGSDYMAQVATGKYILIFDFQDKENYEKRADQYQKLLSTLKIPE